MHHINMDWILIAMHVYGVGCIIWVILEFVFSEQHHAFQSLLFVTAIWPLSVVYILIMLLMDLVSDYL